MKSIKEIEQEYELKQKERKAKIKEEPNRFKRFWKYVWFYISFPFIWLFYNIRDWHTLVIFIIVMLVIGSEVWVPYLLAFITRGTGFSKWMMGVGSVCWIFWLGPFTPFLPLCIVITIGIKTGINKWKLKDHTPKMKNKISKRKSRKD